MPRYSYNNITIIVTNIIMLELLSAGFVHPVTLLAFNRFFNMSQNIYQIPTLLQFLKFCHGFV